MPHLPLNHCDPNDVPIDTPELTEPIPVLFGSAHRGVGLEISDKEIFCSIDLFGSSFFMLTRYEEIVTRERDAFDRFPATASTAYRENFLDRPIVNEYLEILWAALNHLWPQLQRRQRSYRAILSHDVDWPLVTLGLPWKQVAKSAAGDVAVRRDPVLAFKRLVSRVETGRGRFDRDVGNVFDFIMDLSEKHDLKSAFYFIAGHSGGSIDGTYDIQSPWIRSLVRTIHDRGHEIGFHGSFKTYQDAEQTKKEVDTLLSVCDQEGIQQDHWGGRQHYLRWSNPDTWRNWERAGLSYDSTLAYAGQAGFRSGVCYEYPVFDLLRGSRLPLRERPLIVMEATLFSTTSNAYMSLPDEVGLALLECLSQQVRRYAGDFTLLWHNSSLIAKRQRRLYQECLRLT
jgi:peptidoglycan/xylan/chitin deacetylase (PgdA/CDA1 family)